MSTRAALAACVGHFRIPDNAAVAALRGALDGADRLLVLVGSAFRPRSPRNPFGWEERARMLREALPQDAQARVEFQPLREHHDEERTERDIATAIAGQGAQPEPVRCLRLDEPPEGSPLAPVLFSGDAPEAVLQVLAPQVPDSTLAFLRGWIGGEQHQRLCEEWAQLQKEKTQWSAAPYPVVLVTVDAVVRAGGHVLLIRRGRHPGKGLRALPGGFLDVRETVLQSALRELAEETRLALPELRAALRGVRVFDHPWRSERGRVITHAHHFDLGTRALPRVDGADDAAAAEWVRIEELAAMEDQFLDDHFQILEHFLGDAFTPFPAGGRGSATGIPGH